MTADKRDVSRLALVLPWCFLVQSCGSAPPPAAPPPPPPPSAAPAPAAPAPRPAGTLYRNEVDDLINQGFPAFLQKVQVEPSLDNGRFRGWAIVSLSPPEFWQGVDLKPGDVVVSVNGLPIERETEAFDAFESLRAADRLEVKYFRAGQPRTLAYKIITAPR